MLDKLYFKKSTKENELMIKSLNDRFVGPKTISIFNEVVKLQDDFKTINKKIELEKDRKLRKELITKSNSLAKLLLENKKYIPNILNSAVPIGSSESSNKVIFENDHKKKTKNEVIDHLKFLEINNLTNSEQVQNHISGFGFNSLIGEAAKFYRKLIDFFLEYNTSNGYKEVMLPHIVNYKTMENTGQLPKFEADLFRLSESQKFLIPTGEVTLTNYFSNKIVEDKSLPFMLTTYSRCFRNEKISHGKNTTPFLRILEFGKVEVVNVVSRKNWEMNFSNMQKHVESLLDKLNLPYRKVLLCSSDTSFSSEITYDYEVWLPSLEKYVEVSSVSSFGDFQSRRMNLRTINENKEKEFPITLNGSCLPIDRIFAALIENKQNVKGEIDFTKII